MVEGSEESGELWSGRFTEGEEGREGLPVATTRLIERELHSAQYEEKQLHYLRRQCSVETDQLS